MKAKHRAKQQGTMSPCHLLVLLQSCTVTRGHSICTGDKQMHLAAHLLVQERAVVVATLWRSYCPAMALGSAVKTTV